MGISLGKPLSILNKDRDDFRDHEALIYLYQNGKIDIREYKALNLKGAGYSILQIAKELVNQTTKERGISYQLAKSILNHAIFRVQCAISMPENKNKIEFTDSVFKKMFL